ncbi:MotA/TolQ/ExbB proton channel family protein [Prosthecobacter sp.]|jgi:hypothetical protein|uniref:MotA/TolQ/ExbB proton channel family protein n=1 Tax=Prosthecobacter sp. TaxID=1965333 RepID=UPI003783ECD9
MNDPPSNNGAFIAKLGAWLQLAQVIGFGGTVIGMMKSFKVLSESGRSDPSILNEAIGGMLISTFIGIALSLIGIVLVIIAITACRYRSAWMFWFLCIYGGLMSFSHFFPFGLFFFIYALVKKDEFLKPQQEVLPPSCSLES